MMPMHIVMNISVGKKTFTAHLHLDEGMPTEADSTQIRYLIQEVSGVPIFQAARYIVDTQEKEQSNDEG